ncbi:MAG: pyruvate kinase [Gammaproteobacteria bacterium]|nr:MAG: pyruvate kinase [Gammaproteobacteria bacterium]
MLRRTKIVATLGPATSSPEALESIIAAGVDVVRVNFSHGSAEEHINRVRQVREISAKLGKSVAVLADLQGPKLRIARFADNKVILQRGQRFVLDAGMDKNAGDVDGVGIDYEQLTRDVKAGDVLLLDDGRIELEVEQVAGMQIICKVIVGGVLSNNKGLNRKGGGLSAAALTDKDIEDIGTAARMGADFIAVSFVRCANDLKVARDLARKAGSDAHIIAKIERAELVQNPSELDDVIRASDGVMVARGDLAVEIGDAELVVVQKHIISRTRTLNRPVITATQMMESMIHNPMPTRAEVSDVANAVFDYTDAVMLSAESAVGDYPVEAVQAMARICEGSEKHPSMHQSRHRIHEGIEGIEETIALSVMYAANHLKGVKAVICLTESGATPLLASRIKSSVPIFAFSRHFRTQCRTSLYRGVYSIPFDMGNDDNDTVIVRAIEALKARNVLAIGDLVAVTKGDYSHAEGGTNTMKIIKVM